MPRTDSRGTARAAGSLLARAIAYPLLGVHAYLLALVAAARTDPGPPATPPGEPLRFTVLVPAHDEAAGIGATLDALAALAYPPGRAEVVVVADNCSDATAAVARGHGATVWERTDPERRGKGHALAWALDRIAAERPEVGAVAFVDADCRPSENLLGAFDARLRTGADAVQAGYDVANPEASWSAGLRWAAFALITRLRPQGKSRLGLSCGLLGTGMAFSAALLARHRWNAFSVAEDHEFHLRLVAQGERVVFAPEASVTSPMPTSLADARDQQLRWEAGRSRMVREWTAPLVAAGLRRGDPGRVHAGLEGLVPAQSLLLAANAAGAGLAFALGTRADRRLAGAAGAAQVLYVVGGLAVVRAPRSVWRSLAMAPVLALWKVGLYGRLVRGRGPDTWVRTARPSSSPTPGALR